MTSRPQSYPILEFDPEPKAFIEPAEVIKPIDTPEHCVICFFREVIEKVAEERDARILKHNRWEDGPHPLYEIIYAQKRLAFFHPGIGGPLSAALLEEVIGFGCRKFIAIGGCGVLARDLAVGKLIVVAGAVRDEGTSYHYAPPAREIQAQPGVVGAIQGSLADRAIPFITGKTWTTDAPYRETRAKIEQRRAEGCLSVEMEAASLMAVAAFRQALFGQILYAGDDLSGERWDNRGWQSRREVREQMFWLAADICLSL